MPKKREWTLEEIQKIIKWYQEDGFSISYIAKTLLKCRESTISQILKDNNITIKHNHAKRKINSNQEKEIIDLYVNHHYTQSQIAEKFNCCAQTIRKILIKNQIPIVSQPRINKEQNDKYFDNINDEHKAYWLGFIFADGCIFKNQLIIEIHEKDKELLDKFKQDLNLNSKISIRKRKNTTVCTIRLSSPHLCESLSHYGIVPDKTYKTKHLPEIPQELLPHFMRGLIDGDGWISIDKKGYYHIGFVSNYASVCEDFKRYCNILTNNQCKMNITYKRNTPCIQIQSKTTTKLLANVLYKDSTICLSRKYRLIEPLLDFKNDEDIV